MDTEILVALIGFIGLLAGALLSGLIQFLDGHFQRKADRTSWEVAQKAKRDEERIKRLRPDLQAVMDLLIAYHDDVPALFGRANGVISERVSKALIAYDRALIGLLLDGVGSEIAAQQIEIRVKYLQYLNLCSNYRSLYEADPGNGGALSKRKETELTELSKLIDVAIANLQIIAMVSG